MELHHQNMNCLIFQFYVTLLVTPTDGTLLEPFTRLITCPDSVEVIYLIWKKVKRHQQNNITWYFVQNCSFAFNFFLYWFFFYPGCITSNNATRQRWWRCNHCETKWETKTCISLKHRYLLGNGFVSFNVN